MHDERFVLLLNRAPLAGGTLALVGIAAGAALVR
jgi:hypothetical protein